MISSLHNASTPPETEINPPKTVRDHACGGIITNGHTHTQSSHPTECPCQCTNAYMPGDPHRVQLENVTTTTTGHPPATLQPGDATRQAQSAGRWGPLSLGWGPWLASLACHTPSVGGPQPSGCPVCSNNAF